MLVTLTGFLLLLLLLLKRCHSGIGATTSKSVVVDVLLFVCRCCCCCFIHGEKVCTHILRHFHIACESLPPVQGFSWKTQRLWMFWRRRTFTTTRIDLRAKQGQLSTNVCLMMSCNWCDPGQHIPSIAFRHPSPNSASFSYATEGALFISAQLSTDAVSALRKVRVLILSLIHIWRCRRASMCRSRWSPYH